ncbi:MAG: hypothetical protein IKI75_10440 [Lachnospiraceae bacterium]|nr:hypothetical protein [Lachnospiraceae bacterium]
MSGLAGKAMGLTLDIEAYLKEVAAITPDSPLTMLLLKGRMLKDRTGILMGDLDRASEDEEAGIAALQIREGLHVELKGLEDVIASLETADRSLILSGQAVLEKQITDVKKRFEDL